MNRTLIVNKVNLTEKYNYRKQNNWKLRLHNCFNIENNQEIRIESRKPETTITERRFTESDNMDHNFSEKTDATPACIVSVLQTTNIPNLRSEIQVLCR